MKRVLVVALVILSVGLAGTAAPASPAGGIRLPNLQDPVIVLADQPYGLSPGPAHTFDAYLPGIGGGPFPGVVLIHGGGWRNGSKRDMSFIGRYFARRGVAAFSINYRLVPRHPWPAQLEDAQAAVEWIRSQAETYDLDPARLGAFGVSAGGHLASMLSVLTDGQFISGAGIKAAVAWSAPMDLLMMSDLSDPNDKKIERFLGCDSESECEAVAVAASPITYVDRSDPWLYFVNSKHERVPVGMARKMDSRMKDVRAFHTYVELPGDKHAKGYKNDRVPGSSKTVLEASFDFLAGKL